MKAAIIPARGGSKRIPGKNIKDFAGRPIITYSIEAALKSSLFDRIIVSTDSEEIAKVARDEGAEVPFIRPASLADDVSTTLEVVSHALEWFKGQRINISQACLIYATAPFIKSENLRKGFSELCEKNSDAVFGVTTYAFPVCRSLKISDKGLLQELWSEHEASRSNDLEEVYHDAGQFYWLANNALKSEFLIERKIYSRKVVPLLIPRYLVQDIDTMEDWTRAELMYKVCREMGIL